MPAADVEAYERELDAALADDLNTARALAALHQLLTRINQALDGDGIAAAARARLDAALARTDAVLGIMPAQERGAVDAEVDALIAERAAARQARDFARADAIRKELVDMGIALEDTPHGTVWRRGT